MHTELISHKMLLLSFVVHTLVYLSLFGMFVGMQIIWHPLFCFGSIYCQLTINILKLSPIFFTWKCMLKRYCLKHDGGAGVMGIDTSRTISRPFLDKTQRAIFKWNKRELHWYQFEMLFEKKLQHATENLKQYYKKKIYIFFLDAKWAHCVKPDRPLKCLPMMP